MPPPTLIGCCGVVPKLGSSDTAQALFARVRPGTLAVVPDPNGPFEDIATSPGPGGGAGGRGAGAPVAVNDTCTVIDCAIGVPFARAGSNCHCDACATAAGSSSAGPVASEAARTLPD